MSKPKVKKGSKVTVVVLDGCMAHIETSRKEGEVSHLKDKMVYGSQSPVKFAVVVFEDGSIRETPVRDIYLDNGRYTVYL